MPGDDRDAQALVPRRRDARDAAARHLRLAGIDPLMAKLLAARGVDDVSALGWSIQSLESAESLLNCRAMARVLADCLEQQRSVLILGDYDCDGATACATLMSAFRAAGLPCEYIIPDRERDGYGLSVGIIDAEVAPRSAKPAYIITVDNGISSHDGVRRARELGVEVLVTDHHLPGGSLPEAALIVNPNQPGCAFESKSIAGCGVAWYVARAFAEELNVRGRVVGFDPYALLPFIALGTVADVVRLDHNNRVLVGEGLRRIRAGACTEGVKALAEVAGRDLSDLTCSDIGYALAPRLNAAGRIEHMRKGVEILLCQDAARARDLAAELDRINDERQRITAEVMGEAELMAREFCMKTSQEAGDGFAITVFGSRWHEGVVGIVAGRLKEARRRPSFVLCQAADGTVKGSGRSIPALHLKHVLDEMAAELPGLLVKYGGHGMAAGVTVAGDRVAEFGEALESRCRRMLTPDDLLPVVWYDGSLEEDHLSIASVKTLGRQVWGSGFEAPLFGDTWEVVGAKPVGATRQHLKLILSRGSLVVDAIAFGAGHLHATVPERIDCLYEVHVNAFRGNESVQLVINHLFEAGAIAAAQPRKASRRQKSAR